MVKKVNLVYFNGEVICLRRWPLASPTGLAEMGISSRRLEKAELTLWVRSIPLPHFGDHPGLLF